MNRAERRRLKKQQAARGIEKQIKNDILQQVDNDRVEALLSCFVLALHEEFGFGKERCLRALYRRVNHARPYLADVIAWQPLPEPYRPGKER